MRMTRLVSVAVLLTATIAPASAQTSEERAVARDLVAKRGDAIVTVTGTLKAHMSVGGQQRQAPDQAVQASATVLDGSGLAVLALSAVDPADIISKNPNLPPQAKIDMQTQLGDIKMRTADGTELPAQIALRDSDNDLLFVRPVSAPPKPLASVAPSAASFSAMDPVVVLQRFGELTGWKAGAAFGTVEVVVEKPRRFYLVAVNTTGLGIGGTVFDLKGQFVGIVTLRASTDAKHNALNGMTGTALQTFGLVAVVIPASEIKDSAAQAAGK